jgi:hypothetical protein
MEEECRRKRQMLQRYSTSRDEVSEVPPIVYEVIRSPGQPLDKSTRAFMEPRFGHDFSRVRIHTDDRAAESARAVNALAYTVGHNIVFDTGRYVPYSRYGQKLIAHELGHTIQQERQESGSSRSALLEIDSVSSPLERESEAVAERVLNSTPSQIRPAGSMLNQPSATRVLRALDPKEPANLTKLRQLLQDDKEDQAIDLMGKLGKDEVGKVLASREFKELAMDSFNNKEMYRAVLAMKGNLYPSLEWMFDEGTNWTYLKDVLTQGAGRGGIERVRTDAWMMKQFVSECNDEEMAEAVDLLSGTLLQKFIWMEAEGSSWKLVRAKIEATASPTEKTDLYANNKVRDLFVDVCNNKEMAEAVILLGGTLSQKLSWMLAEGTDFELVSRVIHLSLDLELPPFVNVDPNVMKGLQSELGKSEYDQVVQMLNRLATDRPQFSYTEQHLERDPGKPTYHEQQFSLNADYEIQYTHADVAVIVRIGLSGAPTTSSERERWLEGIQDAWNHKFHFENDHRLRLTFEPVFITGAAPHTVTIHAPGTKWPNCATKSSGACRADGGNWFNDTDGDVAAHEFGHLIGLKDEYNLSSIDYPATIGKPAPAGAAPTAGYSLPNIMGSGGPVIERHLQAFLDWLNGHRQPGEKKYSLKTGG